MKALHVKLAINALNAYISTFTSTVTLRVKNLMQFLSQFESIT